MDARTSSFPFPALTAALSGANSRVFSRMVICMIYHGCVFRCRPNSNTGWLCPFFLGFSHLLSHFHFLKLVVPLNPFPFLSSFLSLPSLASLITSFFYWCFFYRNHCSSAYLLRMVFFPHFTLQFVLCLFISAIFFLIFSKMSYKGVILPLSIKLSAEL